MTTHNVQSKGADLFVHDVGTGPTIVMAHCLGLDHTVWDGVADLLPDHRVIRYDLRGHGASDAPDGPYSMGTLVADAETICDALDLKDVVFIGLSVGGLIAQGLAVKRLDLVRAMVLSNTAAKLGQPGPWHARAKAARADGMDGIADATADRWHVKRVESADSAIAQLKQANPEGYAATCEAIAGTDFYTPTSGLRLPTLAIAGSLDGATPPDLVRETADLIPGSDFHLIKGAGHIPPVTHPRDVTAVLHGFLGGIGHV
ncbi:alpha/beta fold hydrolase [Octadecabacter sp. G9-8]|uniref:Alpha/beta fold hydrolase n=1 Tax=Octadecabacter dasysiphoniae TaxID=2909341 RepID=A0ABS9CUD2_9RHOB|nr:alpha/beta fold hydrolase [Octadecabacter dasysiphoniae]MCF2870859.1 alpha/beta fold hydrolase [Octadecabacter dasysiphoniae]